MKKEVQPLSFETLKEMNDMFDSVHHFSKYEANLLNELRCSFPKRDGTDKTPQILDAIEFIDEDGQYHPQALVLAYRSEDNIVICQTPHIPFVTANELTTLNDKNTSFEYRTGGSIFEERPISNLICVGTTEIWIQDFSNRCGTPGHSSVRVPVTVNKWQFRKSVNPFGTYSNKDYIQFHISFHDPKRNGKDGEGYASDCLGGLYFKTKSEYEQWLISVCGVEFIGDNGISKFAIVFCYDKRDYYYHAGTKAEFDAITKESINGNDVCDFVQFEKIPNLKIVTNHTKHTIVHHKLSEQ